MSSKTSLAAIASVLAAALLGAAGQFLFQHGAKHGRPGIFGFLLNPYILAGMAAYMAVMVLFTNAFKLGGSVRVLYPIYASTFIWAAVIACVRYGEAIAPIHIVGMVLLIGGITLMSW